MMKKEVYLVCGVAGIGKTWVCSRLADKFTYIPHDDHIEKGITGAFLESKSEGPFITECPFGERILKAHLEQVGFVVRPYFIFEPLDVVKARWLHQRNSQPPKAVVTRAGSIKKRIDEWKTPYGTSSEIFELLRTL